MHKPSIRSSIHRSDWEHTRQWRAWFISALLLFRRSLVSLYFLGQNVCVTLLWSKLFQFVTHHFQTRSLSYVGTVPSLRSGAVRLGQEILSRVFTSNLTFGWLGWVWLTDGSFMTHHWWLTPLSVTAKLIRLSVIAVCFFVNEHEGIISNSWKALSSRNNWMRATKLVIVI